MELLRLKKKSALTVQKTCHFSFYLILPARAHNLHVVHEARVRLLLRQQLRLDVHGKPIQRRILDVEGVGATRLKVGSGKADAAPTLLKVRVGEGVIVAQQVNVAARFEALLHLVVGKGVAVGEAI